MNIRKRGGTITIKFDNRRESAAVLRVFGANKAAQALDEAEAREQANNALCGEPLSLVDQRETDRQLKLF